MFVIEGFNGHHWVALATPSGGRPGAERAYKEVCDNLPGMWIRMAEVLASRTPVDPANCARGGCG